MLGATLHFVEEYCELLGSQFCQGQPSLAEFHAQVGAWNHRTRERAWSAAQDFNAELDLAAVDYPRCLLREHILTTGVGRLDGDLVVLTANPGHAPDATAAGEAVAGIAVNRGEAALRLTEADNISFGSDFFTRFPAGIQDGWKHTWWRKVLRVARRFVEPPPVWNGEHSPEARWTWAQAHGGIGCVDLFPFHSTRDRLSHVAMRAVQQPAQVLLLQIANTTLDLALRARPRVILVASRLGAHLVAERGWRPASTMDVQGHALTMYRVGGVALYVYGIQLFSGSVWGISNDTLHSVADGMRQLATE